MDVSIILVGVAILVQLVMLYVLMDIATSLRIERRYRLDLEVLTRRNWFKAQGIWLSRSSIMRVFGGRSLHDSLPVSTSVGAVVPQKQTTLGMTLLPRLK